MTLKDINDVLDYTAYKAENEIEIGIMTAEGQAGVYRTGLLALYDKRNKRLLILADNDANCLKNGDTIYIDEV